MSNLSHNLRNRNQVARIALLALGPGVLGFSGMTIASPKPVLAFSNRDSLSRSAQREITAVCTAMFQAIARQDVSGYMSYLTHDHTARNGKEITSRAQVEKDLRTAFNTMAQMNLGYSVASIKVIGSTAITTGRSRMAGVSRADGPGLPPHQILAEAPVRCFWVRTEQGWKLKRTERLPGGRVTMDGKPLPVQGE